MVFGVSVVFVVACVVLCEAVSAVLGVGGRVDVVAIAAVGGAAMTRGYQRLLLLLMLLFPLPSRALPQ